MLASLPALEKSLFRSLNAVVEPAVRRGVASSRLLPLSLIVLETTGFKSGETRRTPLWSVCVGPYRVISTARGARSFWIKNLQKDNRVHFFIGGRARPATAIVLAPSYNDDVSRASPLLLRLLVSQLRKAPLPGFAFAVLVTD
ncbi:MAG: nitroreductase/quinone reductase family protein [Halioglobus sp.]|nr:nitroreductase/quinone reductase family protein [Halioglobus sp.]